VQPGQRRHHQYPAAHVGEPSSSWPASARCSPVDPLAGLIPWPSAWCSPAALDPGDRADTQPGHQHHLVQPGQRRPPPAPSRPRRRPSRVPGRLPSGSVTDRPANRRAGFLTRLPWHPFNEDA
jgi:hypothetical protein